MTALALDVRELGFDEIDEVSGGPGPLLVLAWIGGVAVAAVVGEFAIGVVNGMVREFNDGD